jgi:6-phosphogluconate dehydrogenase
MVHNGIEYGLMAAYAEGLNILKHANVGKQSSSDEIDAETTPLRDPEHYQYDLDLADRSPRCGGAAASSPRGCST